jgi:hypothetical protein
MKIYLYAAFVLSLAISTLSGCSNISQAKNSIETISPDNSVLSKSAYRWEVPGHMAD